jgi:hypothetical protein
MNQISDAKVKRMETERDSLKCFLFTPKGTATKANEITNEKNVTKKMLRMLRLLPDTEHKSNCFCKNKVYNT